MDQALNSTLEVLARKLGADSTSGAVTLTTLLQTMLTILRNILDHPLETKYRQIKTTNPKFSQSFWGVPEARQLLFLVGFQLVREVVVLPGITDMSKLRKLYILARGYISGIPMNTMDVPDALRGVDVSNIVVPPLTVQRLALVRQKKASAGIQSSLSPSDLATYIQIRLEDLKLESKKKQESGTAASPSSAASSLSALSVPSASPFPLPPTGASAMAQTASMELMLNKLRNSFDHVLKYENRTAQQAALNAVPLAELTRKAEERLKLRPESCMQEELMRQLLRWFKFQFFVWIDQKACGHCGGKLTHAGMDRPTSEDLKYGAHRVELFRCGSCGKMTRFPRYNDPVKLLESRTGRCGEWANCFTFICRALGYEARHVLDWTDHVWTEVYIEKLGRWVHCDPSENAFDTPLLYEAGWGKKLSYIVAFSAEEIIDVTKRYTRNINDLLPRRREVPEEWLQKAIFDLGEAKFRTLSPQRVELLRKRQELELKELNSPKQVKSDAELAGRQSGSTEWRKQRGEMGQRQSVLSSESKQLVFGRNNASSVTVLGHASVVKNNNNQLRYRITPSINDALGGIFFTEKVNYQKGFVCSFLFQITGRGADGFAFVIHNSPSGPNALGKGGSELGYGGIPNSIAIEFDMYENVDRADDPDGNHISIHTRGTLPNEAHHDASLACTSNKGVALPPLNSGDIYAVQVVYQPALSKFSVLFSDVSKDTSTQDNIMETLDFVPILEVPLNLSELLQANNGNTTVYMGFTGATGGLNQTHEVFKWTIHTL